MSRSWAHAKSLIVSKLPGAIDRAPFAEYVNDPVGFMRDVRGFKPWKMQRDIAEALREDRRVIVATCNGAGKTTLLAELILWFMVTRKDAKVITTAGIGAQMRILWRKVRAAHALCKTPLGGELLMTEWKFAPEWYALGIATDEEVNLQGYHPTGDVDEPGADGGLLAVIDEASGVAGWAWDAVSGWMTRRNTYWIACGNPNEGSGPFFDTFERDGWRKFQVSAFDVPEYIIRREWIEEQRRYWGEDSPQYQVRVLGQFPTAGSDRQVFPVALFEEVADETPEAGDTHMGVDIGRGGDRSVAVIQKRGRVVAVESWQSRDLMESTARVVELAVLHGVEGGNIHVDADGLGSGVVDRLRQTDWSVDEVHFGGGVEGDWPDLVGEHVLALNRRAELYWVARQALIHRRAVVPREYRNTIWREASNVQSLDPGQSGKLRIEPKERVRARIGSSPDYADAWVLSFSRMGSGRFKIHVI